MVYMEVQGVFVLVLPPKHTFWGAGPIKNLYNKTTWRVMKSLDLLFGFRYLHANVEVSPNGIRIEICHTCTRSNV